ncbi:MAG TPA: sugar ABC transporter permease [Spirochaetia bacterium]|nr:sugar ABC transporter permease [Spirochaetia bacterium]
MAIARARAGRHRSVARRRAGVLLTLPAFLFVFAFLIYPIADLVRVSFHDYSPLRSSTSPFVGLANYRWMAGSDTVWHSLSVTLLFTGLSVLLETALGLLAALLLAKLVLDTRSRWSQGLARAANGIFILPFAAPGIVAAIAWKMLLHPQFSPINALLGVPVAWFTDFPLASIVVADAWKTTPLILFLVLSALLSIDNSQFEAARIDGARSWHELVYLTLPAILPVLLVTCAFRAVDAFTKVFDIVFGTTGGGPGNDTQVFPLLIWQTGFTDLRFGEAASLAVLAIAVSAMLGWILVVFRRDT